MSKILLVIWPPLSALLVVLVLSFLRNDSTIIHSNYRENEDLPVVPGSVETPERTRMASSTPSDSPPANVKANISAGVTQSQKTVNEQDPLVRPRPSDEQILAMRQEAIGEHENLIAAHDREAKDTSWAIGMESEIEQHIREFEADTTARFESADCRERTCAVVLTWPSYQAALSELQQSMQMVGSVPCGSQITLPFASGSGQYKATMLLDCSGRLGNRG